MKKLILILLCLFFVVPETSYSQELYSKEDTRQDLVEDFNSMWLPTFVTAPKLLFNQEDLESITGGDILDRFAIINKPEKKQETKQQINPKPILKSKLEDLLSSSPSDEYSLLLGKFLWDLLKIPAVKIILTVLAFSLLSQSVFKPIYGEVWAKGLVTDIILQIKGIIEAIVDIILSISSKEK